MIAVTPFSLASSSRSNGFSPKNAMSMTLVPVSMTARSVSNPMNPGTALRTRSCSVASFFTTFVSERSAVRVVMPGTAASFARFFSLMSETVPRAERFPWYQIDVSRSSTHTLWPSLRISLNS